MTRKQTLFTTAAALALVALAGPALAQAQDGSLGAVAQRITSSINAIPDLLGAGFQAAGLFLGGKTAFALKAMAEDNRDSGLARRALITGIAAVALVGLPAALGVGLTTMFSDKTANLVNSQGKISIK